jgi:hypothetical protein
MDQPIFAKYEALLAELHAIEVWDRYYHLQNRTDRLVRDAYRNRQTRRAELIWEILRIKDAESRSNTTA